MSGETETGTVLDVAASGGQVLTRKTPGTLFINLIYQVFFNEGSGRLECEDGGDPGTTTKYWLINS